MQVVAAYRENSDRSYEVPTAKPTPWKPIVMAVVARKLVMTYDVGVRQQQRKLRGGGLSRREESTWRS